MSEVPHVMGYGAAPAAKASNESDRSERIAGTLRLVDALEDLSQERLEELAEAVRVENFEAGQVIHRMAEPIEGLYVVALGRIVISCVSPQGRALMTLKGPRSVFGELFLRPVSQGQCLVRAHVDSQLYKLSGADVLRLCRSSFELGIAFAKIAMQIWTETRQELEDMVFLNARQRVLKLLARLSTEDMSAVRTYNPLLHLSQDELARFVGVTREHINAILHELQSEGVLRIHRRAIRANRTLLACMLNSEGIGGYEHLMGQGG